MYWTKSICWRLKEQSKTILLYKNFGNDGKISMEWQVSKIWNCWNWGQPTKPLKSVSEFYLQSWSLNCRLSSDFSFFPKKILFDISGLPNRLHPSATLCNVSYLPSKSHPSESYFWVKAIHLPCLWFSKIKENLSFFLFMTFYNKLKSWMLL